MVFFRASQIRKTRTEKNVCNVYLKIKTTNNRIVFEEDSKVKYYVGKTEN